MTGDGGSKVRMFERSKGQRSPISVKGKTKKVKGKTDRRFDMVSFVCRLASHV